MTRSSMLEVLGQDYLRTARAKGLEERLVVVRHALKNALIPIVTVDRAPVRRAPLRRVPDRDGLRPPGPGPLRRGGDRRPRLPGDPGHGPGGRRRLRPDQPAGRRGLRRDRPAHPLRLRVTPAGDGDGARHGELDALAHYDPRRITCPRELGPTAWRSTRTSNRPQPGEGIRPCRGRAGFARAEPQLHRVERVSAGLWRDAARRLRARSRRRSAGLVDRRDPDRGRHHCAVDRAVPAERPVVPDQVGGAQRRASAGHRRVRARHLQPHSDRHAGRAWRRHRPGA